ncbi:hypothetical protein [Streptomyces melanogenes]|uniref:hypothetical protein n=1 Tax=Streptomyces melanogenes TaxID=67326 RepID=UPI00167D4D58|nr:hypothetical protein [Streptomyces melanogenes]GGP86439.1 hypothetical protein GCM10010278_76130 [Streptomyces melanogenes]
MTDPQRPVTPPAPRRRTTPRRTDKWLAVALAAVAATVLGAAPAHADDTDPSVGHPDDPVTVIAPGTTGTVTIGVRNNTADWNGRSTGDHMSLTVFAPRGTMFADATLTPVGEAPGPWTCQVYAAYGEIYNYGPQLFCTSPYQGAVVPPGEVRQWQFHLTVPADAPNDAQGQGVFSFGYEFNGSWTLSQTNLPVKISTGDPAPTDLPCPAVPGTPRSWCGRSAV